MTDDTETPTLTNLTEVLAPTHEPATVPAPPETTITFPSGVTVPLRDIFDPRDAPPELEEDTSDEHTVDERSGFTWDELGTMVYDTEQAVEYFGAIVERIEDTLDLHAKALNIILRELEAQKKGKKKRKAKAKATPKVKVKPKTLAKRARR